MNVVNPRRLQGWLPDTTAVNDVATDFGAFVHDYDLGDEGSPLDLESAALTEADPRAELARLRTRRFVRGWERRWESPESRAVVHGVVFEFADETNAKRSVDDQRDALLAAGGISRGTQCWTIALDGEIAWILVDVVGRVQRALTLLVPTRVTVPDSNAKAVLLRLAAAVSGSD